MNFFSHRVASAGLFLGLVSLGGAQTAPQSSQIAVDQQREQIHKQEEVFRITPTLAEADRLEKAGEYAKAQQIYLAALTVLTPAPATARIYGQAVAGLLRCDDQLIAQARQAGDLATVEALLKTSLTYAPNDPQLKSKLAQVEAARQNPQSVTLFTNPAVTDGFKKQVDTVDSLLAQAEQARRTGQYDLAEEKLKTILSLDPYNSAAEKKLEQVAREKLEYADKATNENRTRRLEEVEQKWSNPVHPQSVEAVAPAATTPLTRSNQFDIAQKLKSIMIPSIDFSEATLQNAVDFLNDKTRQLDPDHTGINFIARPEALSQAKPITLSLRSIPLGEALRYITQLAQVKYKVDTSAVFFVPQTASTEVLVRRQFNVTPGFFSSTSAAPSDTADTTRRRTTEVVAEASRSGSLDVKDQLTQRGVEFTADGANAIYLASSGILQVVNTQDQMDLIEELVNAETGQTLMVNIEARFVEINQTDLNDLSFSWNLLRPGNSISSPSAQSYMRGLTGFSNNDLTSLLQSSAATPNGYLGSQPNQFLLSGIMDGKIYSATLEALSQKKSTDLLSAPSVRVRSGERATMTATRTFLYPTAYEAPQIITVNVVAAAGAAVIPSPPGAIPAFPSAFDKQEIGVILNAQPTVGGDNRTIDLSLVPEITDFEGFINYGDPITVSPGEGADVIPNTLVQNQILQPVFNVRRVSTKVFIRDGYTVLLGGLIREDLQTINDKVPVLGDLPLVGRFFQSKANKSVKRNLLIFVSGKIVRPDGERFNPADVAAGNVDAGSGTTAAR